jgi:hypothetical protein
VQFELRLIEEFYGDKTAKRSGIRYINHIHEGLTILRDIKASEDAQAAYCLHPIFQADEDLAVHGLPLVQAYPMLRPRIILLVMEYRNIANAYLSPRCKTRYDEFDLSVLPEVNDMLIADKVQNFKDFVVAGHSKTHANRVQLTTYFWNWLDRLGIPVSMTEMIHQTGMLPDMRTVRRFVNAGTAQ